MPALQLMQKNLEKLSVSAPADRWSDSYSIVILVVLTVGIMFLSQPFGNFPTNDDWLYAEAVRSCVQSGQLCIPGSNAFDFIPIYLGIFVCHITTFSHEVLRSCTAIFHLVGILGLYFTLRTLALSPSSSTLFSSVYAFNPLLLNLSLSFMTDVPALSVMNWSLFGLVKGAQTRESKFFLLSTLMMTFAMSVRQSALILWPALLICAIVSLRTKDRFFFLFFQAIPILAFFCLQSWLADHLQIELGQASYSHTVFSSLLNADLYGKVSSMLAVSMIYVGLFVLPISISLCAGIFRRRNALFICLASLGTILITLVPLLSKLVKSQLMPYSANLFFPPMVGTYCLVGGTTKWSLKHLAEFTVFCDVVAGIGTFVILYGFLSLTKTRNQWLSFVAPVLMCVAAGLVVQLNAMNLDRYYLIALSPVLCCMAVFWTELSPPRKSIWIASAFTALMALYACAGVADNFGFMRAEHEALRYLQENGIEKKRIDAGPVFAFLNGGERFYVTCLPGTGWPLKMRGDNNRFYFRWWPVMGEDYIVATICLPGYHEIRRFTYWSPVSWKHRYVLITKSDAIKG